jgi:hypothetical protein
MSARAAAPATGPSYEESLPLTVVVLTLNEAEHIQACLASVRHLRPVAVLVLDSGSTDATVELATAAGATVMQHPFAGYANQRNVALAAITTEWVYFVDADERVTTVQAGEITARLPTPGVAGYWTPRQNIICGHLMRGGGWWPDRQLRLFRRAAGSYDTTRQVHEIVRLDGRAEQLAAPLIHYNYATWREVLAKQHVYTRRAVADAYAAGLHPRARTYLMQPLRAWWRRFITLHGYRDGLVGLALAVILAAYELRYCIWLGRAWRANGPPAWST